MRDYQDPRYLAIHRIDAAQVLDRAAQRPKGFDIDAFITQEFGIRLGTKPLQLVLKVRGTLAAYLAETPIAPGQKIKPLAGDWREVRVKVADTQQLRNWLGSLGTHGVVMAPAGLREEMRATLWQLAALYDEPAPGQATRYDHRGVFSWVRQWAAGAEPEGRADP